VAPVPFRAPPSLGSYDVDAAAVPFQ